MGAMPGAEALHLHTGGANGPGPINIASADLRRPSNVSAASMPGLESVGGMFGSVDAQVPLMCKFCALVSCVRVFCWVHPTLPTLTSPPLTPSHLSPNFYPHPNHLQRVRPARHLHMQMPSAHVHRPQHNFLSTRPCP